jgi:putative hydrolase of the HAD superfamily
MSITTIVFDFGNVLGFFSHRKAAEQLAVYGSSIDVLQAFLFEPRLEHEFESGRVTADAFAQLVRDHCRLSCDEEQFRLAFADMFTPNDEVCALVPRLKQRYRLLLLSNTNAFHAGQFRRQFAATLNHFDHLVLSHEVGMRKPDAGIFEYCQRRAGCPTKELLFIDDLLANVAGARACDWQGIVYRRGADLARELAELGVDVYV